MTEGKKVKQNQAEKRISKLEDVLFENVEKMVFLIKTAGNLISTCRTIILDTYLSRVMQINSK